MGSFDQANRVRTKPPKTRPGAKVALLSPSWAGPGVFPKIHEVSREVIANTLGLEPVDFATTSLVDATPQARARDLEAAFVDPEIEAIIATIGGDDQIEVLRHLDGELLSKHPTAFFGYSDNTNLLNFLFAHGMSSYHGGSTMVHLARPGGTHDRSLSSLRSALFDEGPVKLGVGPTFSDQHGDWGDDQFFETQLPAQNDPGWTWAGPKTKVAGPLWGGNLEILSWTLAANRWVLTNEAYAGCVLLLETSEEMPSATEVMRMLRNMGERGLLEQFAAVLVGKAKAWSREQPLADGERQQYRDDQRNAVLAMTQRYCPDAVVVFDLDVGHTDPQIVVPYGGMIEVDGGQETVTAWY